MTVHMFRVVAENPDAYSKALIDQWVSDWIAGHDRWDGDSIEHSLTVRNTKIDGSGVEYLGGDFRFNQTDDRASIESSFQALFRAIFSWYRIGYHPCEHDEENGSPCVMVGQIEDGNVPNDIPTLV